MWCFWPVAALLLLLPIAPTLAEVVSSMSVCGHFLLEETPPQIPGVVEGGKILNQNRYKPICQTYRNERRFVTLYDVKNKIPVFSAYKYRGVDGKGRPKKHWKIEPQNMMSKDKQISYKHQAVDTDFRSNGTFDRGHILPSSYACTENDKRSTFTLTNVVPQAGSFNKGSWSRMERCVQCVMDKYCTNSSGFTEGFVVTGAQPGSGKVLNNRVNVPSALWSAFCCYSADMQAWIASAHWGENVPDRAKNKHLQAKTSTRRTSAATARPATRLPRKVLHLL
uniref:Endonuclease domain-containing 1 protein-like n=1 Tax=Stegastes partitus TaxID=144197 RepID=A0A3B4ZKQ8_9TELE